MRWDVSMDTLSFSIIIFENETPSACTPANRRFFGNLGLVKVILTPPDFEWIESKNTIMLVLPPFKQKTRTEKIEHDGI